MAWRIQMVGRKANVLAIINNRFDEEISFQSDDLVKTLLKDQEKLITNLISNLNEIRGIHIELDGYCNNGNGALNISVKQVEVV